MKIYKYISFILTILIFLSTLTTQSFATSEGYLNICNELSLSKSSFKDGIGPEIDDYSMDYKYFSPIKNDNDLTKYPLVIWLHGLGNNNNPGSQLDGNDIAAWGTSELQSRFTETDGAFIFVPRSPKTIGWDSTLIPTLKATIDEFIKNNKNNININQIYLGGYSMGGWMALNMAATYPEMFAAIFVSCPAWGIDNDIATKISNLPVWIVGGKNDVVVNYNSTIVPTWNKIIEVNNQPANCRFSTLENTTYPDGTKTPDEHYSWYSINYDMFSSEDSDYPYLTTVNGNGDMIKLQYPNGMISWLSDFNSDYENIFENDETGNVEIKLDFISIILNFIEKIIALFSNIFS